MLRINKHYGTLLVAFAALGYLGRNVVTGSSPQPKSFGDAGKTVAEANGRFAFELYRRLAQESDDNLFFSPYSISVALAMTAEGARGETAEELGLALGWPDGARGSGPASLRRPWNTDLINLGFAEIQDRFQRQDDRKVASINRQLAAMKVKLVALKALSAAGDYSKYRDQLELVREINVIAQTIDRSELRIANALWAAKDFELRTNYVDAINRYYGTKGIHVCDFASDPKGSAAQINQWVSEHTADKIPTIVDPKALSELTRLVLTNAIYFKAPWAEPFEVRNTKQRDFTLSDGTKVKRPLMHATDTYVYGAFNHDGTWFDTPHRVPINNDTTNEVPTYPSNNGFSLIEIPYHGGEISMVVIAPQDPANLEAIEALLTADNFEGWLEQSKSRRTKLYLPRLKLETSYMLSDSTLRAMGIKKLFAAGDADLTGIYDKSLKDEDLYVSKVIHKTFLEVNEEGTEAAAATAVIADAAATSINPTRPFYPEFRADRPFILAIRDRVTGTVLFLGRINEI